MEKLTYKLEVYEGPLDLLLDLIDKNKIDIMNIPIALICDQYMEYIEQARAMDLELAGEFIVMASELLYIKSKMLLPPWWTSWEKRAITSGPGRRTWTFGWSTILTT